MIKDLQNSSQVILKAPMTTKRQKDLKIQIISPIVKVLSLMMKRMKSSTRQAIVFDRCRYLCGLWTKLSQSLNLRFYSFYETTFLFIFIIFSNYWSWNKIIIDHKTLDYNFDKSRPEKKALRKSRFFFNLATWFIWPKLWFGTV